MLISNDTTIDSMMKKHKPEMLKEMISLWEKIHSKTCLIRFCASSENRIREVPMLSKSNLELSELELASDDTDVISDSTSRDRLSWTRF